MKKYSKYLLLGVLLTSCSEFLTLQPEYQINEIAFYKNAKDVETALTGTYAGLQGLHDAAIVYLGDLTTDNTEIRWTSPTVAETEFDEVNPTPANGFLNTIWTSCFSTISRSNNILSRLDAISMTDAQKRQFRGEALFLRAYSYFYLVRIFGNVPIVEVAFRSPDEIMEFDMTRRPVTEVYSLIINDLNESASLLNGLSLPGKSHASVGAARSLLGKVYLTTKQFEPAQNVLKQVIDQNAYTLNPDYKRLFVNGNNELEESIFEIKYLSGNVGEGNSFSSIFTPARFDMAIFPGNMQGSGRVLPTRQMANAYEPGDRRRNASIGDSVRLVSGRFEQELHGLKFVDFTTGIVGDGGINFTALRYADVLLMYAEALNETGNTTQALPFINQVRERAGLAPLAGLSKAQLTLAIEQERKVEFFLEGHRWFDLLRTGRLQVVLNDYFRQNGLAFTVADHELLMPIPLREIDINPNLGQNPGY
ncbi:RagB/SusD family nutrient uptake outer membrane protein [Arundinibacter roseus]|uniref:RagB/SusD family nutrient uptake outer membrane protein n=1 Tax=Arundinibacter roseus TaxID=2070510 RepID=A0A4R4KH75_9BACT|nr:RagB/SusD family nutrient uptake outer membrane protein [Arundinibacter roseus]TDB67430.1 RagB/SusD family nutrient uptake outer membrane protein [Arundinibacter roseus]